MFVLTQKGEIYLYKINQIYPSREDMGLYGNRPGGQITGELLVNEEPILIKDLKDI